MKNIELTQATDSLANYVRNMGKEPLILNVDGQPVAALMPI